MKKMLSFSILSWALLPTFALADVCEQLEQQKEQALAKQQFTEAFKLIKDADDEYCYNSVTQAANEKKKISRLWGDWLFKEIFQGQPVRFNREQTQRLFTFGEQLAAANKHIKVRDSWQIAFLYDIWQIANGKTLFDSENTTQYSRFEEVLRGYLSDEKSRLLSDVVKKSEVDSFIKELIEAQLLILKPEIVARSVSRGNGSSPVSELVSIRAATSRANLSSSAEQPATTITPIRFQYDSTTLTSQGETEYRENLKNMQAGTTNSIFLIGHTDQKGSADYNCWLSQCRVKALRNKLIADGIAANKIEIAWAGENIPIEFEHAGEFMARDIQIATQQYGEKNPLLRRVEYELNGTVLKDRYNGKFCQVKPEYENRPCKP